MARPEKVLTEAQRSEIETLAAVLTTDQMADYLGIARRTFFAIMDRDPDIAARYKKGRSRAIGAIAQSLIAKARGGDTTSMIFYLKTQGGWRETSAVEHSAPTGAPVVVTSARTEVMVALERLGERMRQADAQREREHAAKIVEHQQGAGDP